MNNPLPSLHDLCATLELWLSSLPKNLQRRFIFELAENLTVVVRTSVGEPNRQWCIQVANEFVHVLVVWLKDDELGRTSRPASSVISSVQLAISRAENFPEQNIEAIAFVIRSTALSFAKSCGMDAPKMPTTE